MREASAVAGGTRPGRVAASRGRAPPRVAALDLTYSAPKSVSLLFGVGDEASGRGPVRARRGRRVRRSLRRAEWCRGAAWPAGWWCSGPGLSRRRFGTAPRAPAIRSCIRTCSWRTRPWVRRMVAHARRAQDLLACSRGELRLQGGPARGADARGSGWSGRRYAAESPSPRRSPPVPRAFSRRRADIEAALDERGTSGPRAAEAAALATRRAKDPGDGRTGSRRVADAGRGSASAARDRADHSGGRRRAARYGDLGSLFDRLAARGLTRRSATFTRNDVLSALCELLEPGTTSTPRARTAADRFLRSDRAVALLPGTSSRAAATFLRRDGRRVPLAAELRYSTPEHWRSSGASSIASSDRGRPEPDGRATGMSSGDGGSRADGRAAPARRPAVPRRRASGGRHRQGRGR